MKKVRNTAMFVRILYATPFALLMPFASVPVFALSANQQLQCDVGDLKSDANAIFQAKWCEECTVESLKSTTCRLDIVDEKCVYSGDCKGSAYGYDAETLINQGTAHMKCSAINYPITYWLYDGVNDSENPSSYTVEDTIVFKNPRKTGYAFVGWYNSAVAKNNSDPEGLVQRIDPGTRTGAVSLHAGWTENRYNLVYNCANENDDITYLNFKYNDLVMHNVPQVSTKCVYTGFVPNGWECTRTEDGVDVSSYFVERSNIQRWQIDSDVICNAKWTEKTYNIVYKEQTESEDVVLSGENLEPTTYKYSDLPLIINAEPDNKIGYDFSGWCTSKTKETCSFDPVIYKTEPQPDTTTFWADWTPINYSIEYRLYGGENYPENPNSYTIEEDVYLSDASKDGYVFDGWALRDATGAIPPIPDAEDLVNYEEIVEGWDAGTQYKDKVLHALWHVRTYDIIYHGTAMEDVQWEVGVNHPSEYNINSEEIVIGAPTRPGYVFNGWCDDEELTQNCAMQRVIPTGSYGNKEFYAYWTPINYNINYENLDAGNWQDGAYHPDVYNIESGDVIIDNPSKPGYAFDGWCDKQNNDCETLISPYVITYGSMGDITLYAHWSINDYSITYETDGGEFATTPKTSYNVDETFVLDRPTKTGYDFIGWCDSGIPYCEDEEQVEKTIPVGTTGDLVFYAQWAPTEYGVNYICDLNDETPALTEIVEHGDSYTFRTDNTSNNYGRYLCEKTGYSFANWQCSYKDANNDIPVSTDDIDYWDILYDIQCFPVWTENSFNISFDSNSYFVENDGAMLDISCGYEEGCVLPKNQYVYSGYTFVGWKIKDSEDDTVYPDESIIKHQTTDIVLKAQWIKAKQWCDAGTYLARGDYDKCTVCEEGYYCPDSQEWEYSSSIDQGRKSCKSLMGKETDATSLPGASKAEECFMPCDVKTGYVLKEGRDVMHYPADKEECVYAATIVYNGDSSCSEQTQTYEYDDKGVIKLCVPNEMLGRIFLGWIDNMGNKYDISYNPELSNIYIKDLIPQNGYIVMTPMWDIKGYKLTYDCGVKDKTVFVAGLEYGSEEVLMDYDRCNNPGYTFVGWMCEGVDVLLDAGKVLTMPDSDVVCTAKIEENRYTIKYDSNGGDGEMPGMDYIKYNEPYALDENRFIYKGYDFAGWCADLDAKQNKCNGKIYKDQETVSKLTPKDEDVVVLYAMWTPTKYTITYRSLPNDAVVSPENPSFYYVTSDTFTLTKPVIRGYDFLGWCDIADKCSTEQTITQGTVGDLVFYAKISPTVYNINYNYVDENKVVHQLTGIEPSTFTVANPVVYPRNITIPGYAFKDWYTGSDLRYKTSKTGTSTYSDINVYAKVEKLSCPENQFIQNGVCVDCWEHSHSGGGYATTCECDIDYDKVSEECVAKEYSINYNYNGGDLDSGYTNPDTYTVDMQTIQLNTPVKEGYEFLGLYLNSRFTGNVVRSVPDDLKNNDGSAKGNITLYAKWQGLSCKENQYVQNNTCVDCWEHSHSDGGTVTTCDCDKGYAENSGACDLIKYSIEYELNDGYMPEDKVNPDLYTVEMSPIDLFEPEREDYTFIGWYKNKTLTDSRIYTIPGDLAEDLTLYAGWAHEPCDVNYYLQKESCEPCPSNSYSAGGYITECTCNDGYEKRDGVCVEKEYSIKYVYNGGNMQPDEENPTKYKVSDANTELKAPVKENYIFAGWYLSSRFSGNAVTSIPGNLTGGDKTLYAKWRKDQGMDEILYDCTNGNEIVRSGYVGSNVGIPTDTECSIDVGEIVGWNCAGKEYSVSDSIEIPLGGLTCKATISYANTEFNIIYKAFDKNNNEIDMSFVQPNTFIPSVGVVYPTNINVAGYSFKGWYTGPNLKYPTQRTSVAATSDVTVYAKLETLKVHCDSGTYLPESSSTCSLCEENKYCLGGDYVYSTTESQGEKDCDELYPYSDAGASSYAKCYKYCEEREYYDYDSEGKQYSDGNDSCEYTAKIYRVYYELNGGEFNSPVFNPYLYSIDMPNITSLPTPDKSDKIFGGWKDADGDTVDIINTSEGRDITLYAQWNPLPCAENEYLVEESCVACPLGSVSNGGYATECDCEYGYNKTLNGCELARYNITYDNLGDATHENPETYTIEDYGMEIVAPENRSGYMFAGWTRNGKAFTKIPDGLTGDIVLKANWKDLICGINYFIKDGLCVPCGDNAHSFGGTVTECVCNKGFEDISGVCVPYTYAIEYEYNGGTLPEGVSNPTSYTKETPKTQLNNPEKANYLFKGWYNNKNFSGNRVDYIDPKALSGSVKLYAKWEFECASGKWINIGGTKMCLYDEDNRTHPAIAIDLDKNGVPYYILLSDDANKTMTSETQKKLRVDYGVGQTFNAYDKSAD